MLHCLYKRQGQISQTLTPQLLAPPRFITILWKLTIITVTCSPWLRLLVSHKVFQHCSDASRFWIGSANTLARSKSSSRRLALKSNLPIPFKQASKAIRLMGKTYPQHWRRTVLVGQIALHNANRNFSPKCASMALTPKITFWVFKVDWVTCVAWWMSPLRHLLVFVLK